MSSIGVIAAVEQAAAPSALSRAGSRGLKNTAPAAADTLASLKAYFDGVDGEVLAAAKPTTWVYVDPSLTDSELELHLRRLHPEVAAGLDRYLADMNAGGLPGDNDVSGNGTPLTLAALARQPDHLALLFDIPI
jgi:hypothetical protein